jgi:hypothetical protein
MPYSDFVRSAVVPDDVLIWLRPPLPRLNFVRIRGMRTS